MAIRVSSRMAASWHAGAHRRDHAARATAGIVASSGTRSSSGQTPRGATLAHDPRRPPSGSTWPAEVVRLASAAIDYTDVI